MHEYVLGPQNWLVKDQELPNIELPFAFRITLDVHEFIALEEYHDRREKNCLEVPIWALVAGSISNVLLVLNSSVNFVIYCCMAKEFRWAL